MKLRLFMMRSMSSSGNGGVTDLDGNFTVNLKGKSKKLKISYIGMKAKEVSVAGKESIDVKLEDDNTTLNDVVVIGYGTVRKKDLTGSVSSISDKQIANIPVSNVSEAMTGKMAGVNITTTEGSPDADVKIIREIAERTEAIERGVEALVDARKVANKIESEREKAVAYHDTVAPKMEEIRYQIDKLELLVADELWTLPKYRELLFIR